MMIAPGKTLRNTTLNANAGNSVLTDNNNYDSNSNMTNFLKS